MDAHKDISRVQVLSVSDTGRRRRWTLAEKTRIVEESYLPGISASEVARRHGISRSQMYEWRYRYRLGQLSNPPVPVFSALLPVGVAEDEMDRSASSISTSARGTGLLPEFVIELGAGRRMRFSRGADVTGILQLIRGLEGKA